MPGRLAVRIAGSLVVLLGLGGLGVALAGQQDQSRPEPSLRAQGALALESSRAGAAILTVDGLGPGQARAGDVKIRNTGQAAGALKLSASRPRSLAGNGTLLSRRLRLQISDVTVPPGQTLYEGPLASTPGSLPLLTLPAGDHRDYRFRVLLPAGDPAGNSVQRAAAGVDYAWTLSPATVSTCGNAMSGRTEVDMLAGTDAGDRIHGLEGDDRLIGRGGDDCLIGGDGDDRIAGQAGDDQLGGAPGYDTLTGGQGDDRLRGGPDPDRLFGGPGDDVLKAAGGGVDRIDCGSGTDTVSAGKRDSVVDC